MDEQLLIDGCKRGEALDRKELYELYAPAMMSVCVPVNLVINLWDNPDWNVYVSGGEHDRERSALRVLKINGIV